MFPPYLFSSSCFPTVSAFMLTFSHPICFHALVFPSNLFLSSRFPTLSVFILMGMSQWRCLLSSAASKWRCPQWHCSLRAHPKWRCAPVALRSSGAAAECLCLLSLPNTLYICIVDQQQSQRIRLTFFLY